MLCSLISNPSVSSFSSTRIPIVFFKVKKIIQAVAKQKIAVVVGISVTTREPSLFAWCKIKKSGKEIIAISTQPTRKRENGRKKSFNSREPFLTAAMEGQISRKKMMIE